MTKALIVVGLFVAACATGCAQAPKAPPAAPVVHAVAEPDSSGLTILLSPELDPSETRRAITNELRAQMQAAGYHVLAEPKGSWDLEIIPRVDVWGREFELAKSSGAMPDVHEHIKLTFHAVAMHDIIATSKSELVVTNGKVDGDDVIPALNALSASPRFRGYAAKVQQERERRPSRVASAK